MTALDTAKLAWLTMHAALTLGGSAPDLGHTAMCTHRLRTAVDVLSRDDRVAFNTWANGMADRMLALLQAESAAIHGRPN